MTKAGRGYGEIVMVFREGKLVKEILQKFLLCGCPEVLRILVVCVDSLGGNCGIFVGMDGGMIGMFRYVGMDGRMVRMFR